MPEHTFQSLINGKVEQVHSKDIFKGKKVVIFGIPVRHPTRHTPRAMLRPASPDAPDA